MARQIINVGQKSNDGTGDAVRQALIKINQNFSELYNLIGGGAAIGLRSLDDGVPYAANQLLMGSTLSGEVNPVTGELINQLSARTLVAGSGISIDASSNTEIVLTVTVPNLSANPELGTAFNISGHGIGNVPMPTAGLVSIFNTAFPLHNTTLDQLVAPVGYVNQQVATVNALNKLVDVDISNASNGEMLLFQNGWKNVALPMGDVVISYIGNQLTTRIPNSTITNVMVSATAGIEQRKIALLVAPNRTTNEYSIPGDRGIASFNSAHFTNSNGWIGIKPFYIGTTEIAIDRANAPLALDSITLRAPMLSGSTSPVVALSPTLDEDGIVDAAIVSYFSYIKNDATSRNIYINHLIDGRAMTLYIKNMNSGAPKTVTIYASASTNAHTACSLTLTAGSVAVSSVTLDASGGSAILTVFNIDGAFVGI